MSTLPYLSPELKGRKLLIGANFGSAGIGILNDTGVQFVSSLITDTLSLLHLLVHIMHTQIIYVISFRELSSVGSDNAYHDICKFRGSNPDTTKKN